MVALPFCHLTLEGEKPPPDAYPAALDTIGDHIRKHRLDTGLLQKEAAEQIGVTTDSITNWELGRTEPAIRYMPGIVNFLGYVPFSLGDSFPERLMAYRMIRGLSQKQLARELGIDPTTVRRWEAGIGQPSRRLKERVAAMLSF